MTNKEFQYLVSTLSVGDPVRIEHCAAGDAYANTNAIIREKRPDGTLWAELTVFYSLYGAEQFVLLKPGDFIQKVELHMYEVTVCRTGVTEMLAADSEQALSLTDRFARDEDVSWSEDWPADDAQLLDENGR